ncbi:MAG: threonine--tRNA ligase [Myxococcota bacterium]
MEELSWIDEKYEDPTEAALARIRHSCAHVLAQAVQRLWPQARLAIGPPVKDGFYYDIEIDDHQLSEDDFGPIELQMKKIVKENQTFEMVPWPRDKLLAYYKDTDQTYKLDMLNRVIPDDPVSVCENKQKKTDGVWIDMCKGGHVARTGNCKHFKLLRVSGAYWRGDSKQPMLQRIYGTAWKTRDDLDLYMHRLEEAKKRDHRKIGRELELFMFHDWAPGSAFWLPAGEDIYNTLATRMRSLLVEGGYSPVRTPLVFDKSLFETSGHWDHYRENMYHFDELHPTAGHTHSHGEDEDEGHNTGRVMGLKPMNCPSHMLIFGSKKRSYRELPIRIHDQGVLHRNELSGALSGLTRVRQFSQDDAHIFCTEDQLEVEVQALLALIDKVYSAFGMRVDLKLSTRPDEKLGDDALWDKAESALRNALNATGRDYTVNEGDGAFYGPKIDFDVYDALERTHQCATVQLDFQLPRRFDLSYVGADNQPHVPVVIHRAVFGSFERFIGILIEHYAGAFPVWLAPEQVRVMTVSEKSEEHGRALFDRLKAAGVKVHGDFSGNKIGYKIRECHGRKVPYMAIIGEKEKENGDVSIRSRDEGDIGSMSIDDFVAKVKAESEVPF